jgi:hypothetical protein
MSEHHQSKQKDGYKGSEPQSEELSSPHGDALILRVSGACDIMLVILSSSEVSIGERSNIVTYCGIFRRSVPLGEILGRISYKKALAIANVKGKY